MATIKISVVASPECSDEPPAKKRRRVGAVAKKRKASEGRGLGQLCIDELYIIFAYVYPMDLLNLARMCKYLRSHLMHKSSQFLWKSAFSRLEGLPDCPADLTEPQYTNLVFYNRCHGCDKPAKTVLWNLRRRYCPACKVQRLRYLDACDCLVWYDTVVPRDRVTISGIEKEQFLDEKRKSCQIIYEHACDCAEWQRGHGRVKRFDLEILRQERQASILERLRQHGYGPELAYIPQSTIQNSYKSAFKPHTRLTDSEWEQMWPKWVDIMNNYRSQRLNATCYRARRRLLISEYNKYVRYQTPGTPTFDLLPHAADLASFPPFQNIIEAPEEAQMGEEPFASAFAQLPMLLGEWKKQFDLRFAELIKIPRHLSVQDTCCVMESSSAATDPCPKGLAKLHLACAQFGCFGRDLFTHREALLTSMRYQTYPPSCQYVGGQMGTTRERLNHSFLEEAPYIVHACGLDPNVATADDMDRRNARPRCLACESSSIIVMDWKNAMLHACSFHRHNTVLMPLSESSRWQVISDDHIGAIQAVENSVERSRDYFRRCLLCRPRMGDVCKSGEFVYHMRNCHGLDMTDVKEGVHYERLGLEGYYLLNKVEMVEDGGQVIFRQRHRPVI